MSEELIPCPVCLGTEFDAAQMDHTDAEQCQNCLCVWRKADLIRLRHNARVAKAAETYVMGRTAMLYADLERAVNAARDCRAERCIHVGDVKANNFKIKGKCK